MSHVDQSQPERQMRSTNQRWGRHRDIASDAQSVNCHGSSRRLPDIDKILRVADSVCGAENADRKS